MLPCKTLWGTEFQLGKIDLNMHYQLSAYKWCFSKSFTSNLANNHRIFQTEGWAAVYGVAQSQTRLKGLSSSSSRNNLGEGSGTPLQYSCLENPMDGGAWWAAVHGVAKSRTRLSDFTFTFHFHALGKEMATHSSVLAWRIPGMGEPGGLPSLGLHRVGHD